MLHFCMCTKMSCSLNRFLSKIINETFYLKVFCLKNNNCYLQVIFVFILKKVMLLFNKFIKNLQSEHKIVYIGL